MKLNCVFATEIQFRYSNSLRKEGHTKIVELDLTVKQKQQHQLMKLKRPDVLRYERDFVSKMNALDSRRQDASGDEDDDIDDSNSEASDEPAGETTFSDAEEEGVEDVTQIIGPAKSITGKLKSARGRNERVMTAEECRAHLRRLFSNEGVMCALLFGRHGPFAPFATGKDKLSYTAANADMFFMECLLVPPTRFRPVSKMGDSSFEHPQNEMLTKVLNTSYRLRDFNNEVKRLSSKDNTIEIDPSTIRKVLGSLFDTLIQLQVDVNSFVDSSKNPTKPRQGKLPPAGVKQLLEKKDGLFRMNMMVRSPDI